MDEEDPTHNLTPSEKMELMRQWERQWEHREEEPKTPPTPSDLSLDDTKFLKDFGIIWEED